MFPPQDVMSGAFSAQRQLSQKPQTLGTGATRREPFPAWSVIEDTKKKANAISKEAAREFEIASQKAQSKTGKIEPWSAKYYAACTFGGLLACVRSTNRFNPDEVDH